VRGKEANVKHILTFVIIILLSPSAIFAESKDERLFKAKERVENGSKYLGKEEYDKAIEAFTRAIALNPNDTNAFCERGVAYHNKGQYDRAIEDYNIVIVLYPNSGMAFFAYNNRGYAYDKLGNMGRAISDFQKACDLGNESGCKNLQKALKNR
jgi:tetratricopeptide (TPR) repeat protein